jgi:hypothetical protein
MALYQKAPAQGAGTNTEEEKMSIFKPADILRRTCDMTKWSVIACDQYTSQPKYWQRFSRRWETPLHP